MFSSQQDEIGELPNEHRPKSNHATYELLDAGLGQRNNDKLLQ